MTTTVVYADTSDGYITSTDTSPDYASARSGSTLAADTSAVDLVVGQLAYDDGEGGGYFRIYESFLSFDTSGVASGDTVSAAVLNLTSYSNDSDTDFTINARSYDWGAGLTTADWIAGANLSSNTLRAHKTTAAWSPNTAYDFTDDAMAAGVVKAGTTRLVVCSGQTESNNAPTGYEFVNIKSADTTGTTSDPKLTVTHAASAAATKAWAWVIA